MASRSSIEKSTEEITKHFKRASKAILALIVASYANPREVPEEVALAGVAKILSNLQKKVYPLIEKDVRYHYTSSALEVVNQLKKINPKIAGSLSQAQRLELNGIIERTLSEYGESMAGAFSGAQKMMNEARRLRIDAIFTQGNLNSESLQQIKKKIVDDLSKDFVGLVDKSGKRWSLDNYAEMLTRTRMREVTNTGLTSRLLQDGYDLVWVSKNNSDHKECADWEGKVLSLTGKNVGQVLSNGVTVIGTPEDAKNAGLFHPNCKHRLLAYHPELVANTE